MTDMRTNYCVACKEMADRIERLEAALLMIAIPRVGGGQWASEIARKVMGIGNDA